MNVLLVVCHPRSDSLTQKVAQRVRDGLVSENHVVEWADLYAEKFDPRLMPPDEPDWDDVQKEYSLAVNKEMERIKRNEAMILVFPVWWWNMPAMLKGWIDRVWGYGFAYGEGNTLPLKKIVSIGVSANSESEESSKVFFQGLEKQIVEGMCHYCGVEDATFVLLGDSLGGEERAQEILAQSHQIGIDFKAH